MTAITIDNDLRGCRRGGSSIDGYDDVGDTEASGGAGIGGGGR